MSRSKSASTERLFALLLAAALVAAGCDTGPGRALPKKPATNDDRPPIRTPAQPRSGKPVVYQVFTRLFGNKIRTNRPWGTIETNGVGKFADIDDAALEGISELGVSHVWYTGVPHHAVIRDYSAIGVGADDPDVVKGRAGSPYAVKDYYSVDPDLAVDPAQRLQEFEALIERSHAHGLAVIIDIVPNHVARNYRSVARPAGVRDFGADDDRSVTWKRDNDFYYVPGQDFRVPEWRNGYRPLGGEPHPLADGRYEESPARWTGNGARGAQPSQDDWYETVKINFGLRPDGSQAFDSLPKSAAGWSNAKHFAFWETRDVPASWGKFRDIALYWLGKGVDGFRYDMAEMVPVEFWSYLNSAIKEVRSDAFLLAEVYQPQLYRDYLQLGRMDYLYDKVELYDTLKAIIRGEASTDTIPPIQDGLADIEQHMLHFLENHDEQRIASPAFAGDPALALPALVVSATIGRSPTMVYFGQEVGEDGAGDAGFGDPTRTTIFDYWGVPAHQRWMNGGRFDGGALSEAERRLRDYYVRVLNLSASNPAMTGGYADLHRHNRAVTSGYDGRLLAFARWRDEERLIVLSNFAADSDAAFELSLPGDIADRMGLPSGSFPVIDLLTGEDRGTLRIDADAGRLPVRLSALESLVLRVRDPQ